MSIEKKINEVLNERAPDVEGTKNLPVVQDIIGVEQELMEMYDRTQDGKYVEAAEMIHEALEKHIGQYQM